MAQDAWLEGPQELMSGEKMELRSSLTTKRDERRARERVKSVSQLQGVAYCRSFHRRRGIEWEVSGK